MNGSTERFVALLVGIVAILGGVAGMLRLLWMISWRMGQLVTRFDSHVSDDDKIHVDIEARMRLIERGRRRG